MGSGNSTRFWLDVWLDGGALNHLFPRFFVISVQQNSLISEMGQWEEGIWRWNFVWTRQLFVWEEQLVLELLQIIEQFSLVEGLDDEILWKYDPSGKFTVKSFSLQVFRSVASSMTVYP